MIIEDGFVVMPTADAGIGLPGQWFNVVALSSFNIPHHALALLLIQNLSVDDSLQ
jgi:hypothetical protein